MHQLTSAFSNFRTTFTTAGLTALQNGCWQGVANTKDGPRCALPAGSEPAAAFNLANMLFPAWGSHPYYDDLFDTEMRPTGAKVSTMPGPSLPAENHCRSAWLAIDRLYGISKDMHPFCRIEDGDIMFGDPATCRAALRGAIRALGIDLVYYRATMADYAKLVVDPTAEAVRRSALWTWLLVEIWRAQRVISSRAVMLGLAKSPGSIDNDTAIDIVGGPANRAEVDAWAQERVQEWMADPNCARRMMQGYVVWAEQAGSSAN
jgi:hypothetical protein